MTTNKHECQHDIGLITMLVIALVMITGIGFAGEHIVSVYFRERARYESIGPKEYLKFATESAAE